MNYYFTTHFIRHVALAILSLIAILLAMLVMPIVLSRSQTVKAETIDVADETVTVREDTAVDPQYPIYDHSKTLDLAKLPQASDYEQTSAEKSTARQVETALARNDLTSHIAQRILVIVDQDTVILRGVVKDDKEKFLAENVASNVPEVARVKSYITTISDLPK